MLSGYSTNVKLVNTPGVISPNERKRREHEYVVLHKCARVTRSPSFNFKTIRTLVLHQGEPQPNVDIKTLLLLNGHTTQSKNYKALQIPQEAKFTMMQLPGCTTHWILTLDKTMFNPFKRDIKHKQWRNGCGPILGCMATLVAEAHDKAANTENCVNGFQSTRAYQLTSLCIKNVNFHQPSVHHDFDQPSISAQLDIPIGIEVQRYEWNGLVCEDAFVEDGVQCLVCPSWFMRAVRCLGVGRRLRGWQVLGAQVATHSFPTPRTRVAHLARHEEMEQVLSFSCKAMQVVILLVPGVARRRPPPQPSCTDDEPPRCTRGCCRPTEVSWRGKQRAVVQGRDQGRLHDYRLPDLVRVLIGERRRSGMLMTSDAILLALQEGRHALVRDPEFLLVCLAGVCGLTLSVTASSIWDVAYEVALMVSTVHSRTHRPMRKHPYVWGTSFAAETMFSSLINHCR
ncbi:hypothetical protein PR048_009780, partial [Dryococelus australis]